MLQIASAVLVRQKTVIFMVSALLTLVSIAIRVDQLFLTWLVCLYHVVGTLFYCVYIQSSRCQTITRVDLKVLNPQC